MNMSVAQVIDFSNAVTIVRPTDDQIPVSHLCWDSRLVMPGSLFVAFKGDHVDGNDFIDDALNLGAVVIIASKACTEQTKDLARSKQAAILQTTEDTIRASLQALAAGYRAGLKATVVGVTGSSGKTTTKDLIASVLSTSYNTHATPGNRNNEIGLPATILDAEPSHQLIVAEMGMQTMGEIDALCQAAQPDIGVITNIGVAHCEFLGSRENIAAAKAELLSNLPDNTGIAILNGDDPFTPLLREIAQLDQREIKIVLYGLGSHNDIRAAHITYDQTGHPSFELWLPDGLPRQAKVALQGEHNVYNALAAAAVGISLQVPAENIIQALAVAKPGALRQEIIKTPGGAVIINDTYNANPDSMRAALSLLARFDTSTEHIAVLGDMYELGQEEEKFHREIGSFAFVGGVDLLVTVGKLGKEIAQGALQLGMPEQNVVICQDVSGAIEQMQTILANPEVQKPVILVKASRGMQLEQVVEGIRELC